MPEPQRNGCSWYRRSERRSRSNSTKTRKLGHRDRYRAKTEANQKRKTEARYPDVYVFHEQQSGSHFRVVRLSEVRSETGQSKFQLHSAAIGPAERADHRQSAIRQAFAHD